MTRTSYYKILGVPPAESAMRIRAAYRERAKTLHPDVAGEQATRAFQELTEAYSVLSDPQRRRDYNRELSRAEEHATTAGTSRPDASFRQAVVSLDEPTNIGRSLGGEVLNIEVHLSPDEALRGCVLPIGVPIIAVCPRCGGSGQDLMFACLYCRQEGIVEDEATMNVRIPQGTPSGTILEFPLDALGIDHFSLRLHIDVGSSTW